jgi:hypothetical protein
MKIFKRKAKVTGIKKSKGRVFLEGLKNAVQHRKNKESYKENFLAIVNRAEEIGTSKKGKENYDKLREAISREMLKDSVDYSKPSFKFEKEYVLGQTDSNEPVRIDELPMPKKPSKFNLWFKKFKLKIKENWEIVEEFGREVQYWLIAEYKIFTRLSYALNRKKDEVKIRKVCKGDRENFINKYGYDKGTHLFYNLSATINNSVRMHKRMEKQGM